MGWYWEELIFGSKNKIKNLMDLHSGWRREGAYKWVFGVLQYFM